MSVSMRAVVLSMAAIVVLGLGGCGDRRVVPEETTEESDGDRDEENRLTFNDITLEQVDDEGNLKWVVNGKQATYSGDRKLAAVKNPKGELYQNGELVFQIEALHGEVHQNGEKILLKEEVVAIDTQDGAVMTGDELEWLPQDDTLIVRGNLTGTHERADVTAEEVQFFSQQRRLQAIGNVVMRVKESSLLVSTEQLTWEMEPEQVFIEQQVQVERFEVEGEGEEKEEKITDRAIADRAEIDLATQVSTLQDNAQLSLVEPPLQVASNELVWDLPGEVLTSNVPVKVVHEEEEVTMTGNQGWITLAEEIFYLTNGIEALGKDNLAQLIAEKLTWDIPAQEFLAEGNVTYRQVDPPFNLTGPRAEGRLESQTFVISGGRVVTEIIP
ncbi:MAG: LPS export ABC transporter periplasmic protein LptC [Cyanobacteriota bacterium]|nr:LPS export ABC transporter periplasmic protein LptC [Cyanobacteriota bacterium]